MSELDEMLNVRKCKCKIWWFVIIASIKAIKNMLDYTLHNTYPASSKIVDIALQDEFFNENMKIVQKHES